MNNMKQTISTAISNAILDWRDGEALTLLSFSLFDAHTQPFVEFIAKAAKEQQGKIVEGKHLGCRIIYVVKTRNIDLDESLPKVIEGLSKVVVEDKKVFDYIETLRIKAPTPEDEAIVVEILEIVPKREAWV